MHCQNRLNLDLFQDWLALDAKLTNRQPYKLQFQNWLTTANVIPLRSLNKFLIPFFWTN